MHRGYLDVYLDGYLDKYLGLCTRVYGRCLEVYRNLPIKLLKGTKPLLLVKIF